MKTIFTFWLAMLFYSVGFGQSKGDSLQVGDTSYVMRDDTLWSDKGFNIYVGKTLYVGKGSAGEGRFRSVSFKSAVALPLLAFREMEIRNNTDYQSDPSLRDADKVKESLRPGMSLVVKKIRNRGERKKWHFFEVYLWDGKGVLAYKYRCNLAYALNLGELVLDKPAGDAVLPGTPKISSVF